ncbi:MAG TPA: hypothetical protein PK760_03440, partial [Flavobacteriales bacterium]|nr:hypothetical protein [Flavobacteriales bacterium]
MKRRIVLLIVLLVLGGTAWWLATRGPDTTLDKPMSDFAVADTSRVTRIFIADKKGGTVDLRRTAEGWTVNNLYPAQQPQINIALMTFLRIVVTSPVPKASEPVTLRTMGANSTKVEIYEGGDKPSKIWIVGHATKEHMGTYMVLEKPDVGRSSAPFVMGIDGFRGILNTRFPANADDWRSTNVFNFKDLRTLARVEVEHVGRPEASIRIDQDANGNVSLSDLSGKKLPMDTALTKGVLIYFRSFDYEVIPRKLPATSRDSLLKATPNFIVSTTARSGEQKSMKLWYMPSHDEETGFDAAQMIHDKIRMWAFVEDSLVVAVQRHFTDGM